MALTTSYVNATTAKLNREDLSDIISVVDAKSTVLTSSIKKGKKPASAYEEWIVDKYDSTVITGTIDGSDVSSSTTFFDSTANRSRIGNYIQTFRRVPQVSRLQEVVAAPAGVNNPDPNGVAGATEFARAKAKATVQIKRDMEAALLSNNGAVADNGSSTAYTTRGLGKWLSTSADSNALGQSAVLLASGQVNVSSTSGALASFNEDALRSLLQARWTVSGQQKDLIAIVNPGIKNTVSDFTRYLPSKTNINTVRFFNQDVADKQVSTTVDFYSGDYGNVELHLSAFLPTSNGNVGYILDMDYLELRTALAPSFMPLPDQGGGPRGIVEAIVALAYLNPTSGCKIDVAS